MHVHSENWSRRCTAPRRRRGSHREPHHQRVRADAETGSRWDITGRAVEGPLEGATLEPVNHGDHFWFAWAAFVPHTDNIRGFIYDVENGRWSRFVDAPYFEGEGKRNAYPRGPSRGPDGYFHFVWVWRDTPDCATNHDVSYARSADLVHWEAADGTPLALPMTLGGIAVAGAVVSKPTPKNTTSFSGFLAANFTASNGE